MDTEQKISDYPTRINVAEVGGIYKFLINNNIHGFIIGDLFTVLEIESSNENHYRYKIFYNNKIKSLLFENQPGRKFIFSTLNMEE